MEIIEKHFSKRHSCVLCNCSHILFIRDDEGLWTVQCKNCKNIQGPYPSRRQAKMHWRTDMPAENLTKQNE